MKQILKKTGLKCSFSFLGCTTFLKAMSIQAKTMKHYYYVFSILAITIVSGCSKQTSTNAPPANTSPTITVTERTTNKPIAGATVSLQKCSNYDNQFGCTAYSTFATLTTNTEGKVTYSANSNRDQISGNSNPRQIIVDANKYWTLYKKTGIQNVILTPKNSIEVNVKREKTYASTDILWIGQNRHILDLKPIGLPADTIVYIDGYGFSENKIYWYINYWNGGIISTGSTGGSSPNFYVNGFDTARIQIKY